VFVEESDTLPVEGIEESSPLESDMMGEDMMSQEIVDPLAE